MQEATEKRSAYWLSPGIDVPTASSFWGYITEPRALRGFSYDQDAGEARFIPPKSFMLQKPLWRVDVINDIIVDLKKTRDHALVAYFRELQPKLPKETPMSQRLHAFRAVCEMGGIDVPDELETLLVLDHQFQSKQL